MMDLKILTDVINRMIDCYQANPFNYLYEFDIHSELYNLLKKEIDIKIGLKEISGKAGDIEVSGNFSLVKAVYHIYPIDNMVKNNPIFSNIIDLVVLNDKQFNSIVSKKSGYPLYHEIIDVAIELKYQPYAETKDFREDPFKLSWFKKAYINVFNNNPICVSLFFSHRPIEQFINDHKRYKKITGELILNEDSVNDIIIDIKNVYIRKES